MRRLYVTHDAADLAMAWIQAQISTGCFYVVFTADARWLAYAAGQCALFTAVMAYVFLFTMSGSRKREEADKARA